MFCPQCGREAQSGATFCVHCGAALSVGVAGASVAEAPPVFATPAAVTAVPAPAPVPVAVRYGGFWRRFGAFWIDGILLWIASSVVQVSMGADLFESDFANPQLMLSNLVALGMGWLYCALLESGPRQATLGQMVVGVKVTDLLHRRISFARASGRHFAQIISVLILFAGYLMIAFTEKKQGLHDMMAGCLVLRAAD